MEARTAFACLVLATTMTAQAPTLQRGPARMAADFGRWSAVAQGPIQGTGQREGFTIEGAEASFTLPDGTAFQPFAVGDPLAISGDANPETVIIQSVNCPSTGQACSITAEFAHPHPSKFMVSSGTGGLQEAINYTAAHGGGTVEIGPDWGGNLTALLPSIKLPPNVLMIDERGGNWTAYGLGNGGEPSVLVSFSSANGSSVTGATGGLFSNSYNFAAATPGGSLSTGTAATVTPTWTLPAGVVAGDTLYLSGGSGNSEVVTVTNVGAACSGGNANSVCFTPANSHTGAWTLQSATAGLQEAVNAAGPGGWVVDAEPVAYIYAPLVLGTTVRLTGFSAYDASVGTQIVQETANTDVIRVGTAAATANDVDIEHLQAVGVSGMGSDSGVAIHCVSCVGLKLVDVIGKQAHDGVFFDSTNGHAYDADIENSHFIGNFYGVHIVGGSANRLTFVGDTVDGNTYGVYDDGGWVHTWTGCDIESNAMFGYWQQVSQPASYSGHNVDLIGNYFENNGGNTNGQGDVFLGQLVGGGATNNGAGCVNCEIDGNLFNASTGGNVTALNFGSVSVTEMDNTFSGYGAGKVYATISGPSPNYSYVLALGDCGQAKGAGGNSACTQTAPGDITRLDANSALVLGGTDELTDIHGTMLADTTIESPTGIVRLRGKPGGETTNNPAQLYLDGNSSGTKESSIWFNNAGVPYWEINADITGDGGDTFCPVTNLVNPAAGVCQLYVGPDAHFQFSGLTNAPSGDINPAGDYTFRQMANGDSGIMILRSTDTAPTGYLLDIEDSTDSNPLLRVDASGNLILPKGNFEGGSTTTAQWGNGQPIPSSGALMVLIGTLTTTAGASDQITAPSWLTNTGHCIATAQNATAAALTGVYVAPGASVVTLYHSATAGGTFAIACSQN